MKTMLLKSLLMIGASFALASSAEAAPRQVKGILKYDDYASDGTFLGARPIPFVDVSLKNPNSPPIPNTTYIVPIATTTTGSDGYFSWYVDTSQLPAPGSPLRIEFLAKNFAANVYLDLDWENDRITWKKDVVIPNGTPQEPIDLSYTVPKTVNRQGFSVHFNILDAMTWGRVYADGRRGDTDDITRVDVQYPDVEWSHFSNYWGEITLLGPPAFGYGGGTEDHGWSDEIALHEYGHHLELDISDKDGGGGSHSACSPFGFDFAWSEGFPTYFATAVHGQFPSRIDSSTALEAMPTCPDPTAELVTSSVLWDLHDGTGNSAEPYDRVDGTLTVVDASDGVSKSMPTLIFQIFDKEIEASNPSNILGFHTAFVKRRPSVASHAALDAVLVAHGIRPHAERTLSRSTSTDFSDSVGWHSSDTYYGTLRFGDVDGDGRADACGRSADGIVCALGTVADPGFARATMWQAQFGNAGGWGNAAYATTIQLGDVNGDGKADVCGRGIAGVYCALSTGASFANAQLMTPGDYTDQGGWAAAGYYDSIRLGDLDGDGKADLCGRGGAGIYCSISTGSAFGPVRVGQIEFSDANGWYPTQYGGTIQLGDVNGDGKADVCGRGIAGMYCAISSGLSLGAAQLWTTNNEFSDTNGFANAQYYNSIRLADTNGDGRADLCARGTAGVTCALSTGAGFGPSTAFSVNDMTDANGWALPQYGATIQFAPLTPAGPANVCARQADGLICRPIR